MEAAKFNARKILGEIELKVEINGMRSLRYRVYLAGLLFKLAGLIIDAKVDIIINGEQQD